MMRTPKLQPDGAAKRARATLSSKPAPIEVHIHVHCADALTSEQVTRIVKPWFNKTLRASR